MDSDAFDRLIEEHAVILSVLDAVDAETAHVLLHGIQRLAHWARIVAFLQSYADQGHHTKEELGLFPVLRDHGFGSGGSPLQTACLEHEQCREFVRRMAAAVDRGDTSTLANTARAFTSLVRSHLQREGDVLYPLARKVLNGDELAAVERNFDALEEGLANECREYRDLADRIREDAIRPNQE